MEKYNIKYGQIPMSVNADVFVKQQDICIAASSSGIKKEISMDYDTATKLINRLCEAHNYISNTYHQPMYEAMVETQKKGVANENR
ncbi:MAG: hypothetical protein BWY78_00297 [Alphaproteobacteria bacterium ADurb.Bin438]|nr:MAG: hypothetical protein BWY78_00297 [Alphaproteobacteria bacterium ADurb.Bin438]